MGRLALSSPFLGQQELAAVERVFASGYLGMGDEVAEFERELATYIGNDVHVVACSSGTSALQLAVQAFDYPSGEVLVSSLTFVACAQAISAVGMTPVFCDIDKTTGLIDLEDARRKITEKTRLIMPVHYAGYCGDLEALYQFADEFNLGVIEDAAHAFGGGFSGATLGSSGDITCFSFDPIKNITCIEGGALVTANSQWAERARIARKLGIRSSGKSRSSSMDDYDVVMQGWRYHMPNVNAAVGRVQLSRLDNEFAPKRRQLADHYRQLLTTSGALPLQSSGEVVPHIFPVVVPEHREALVKTLAQAEIVSGVHYKPSHQFSFYRGQDCPNADWMFEHLLTLPLHVAMSLEQVEQVCQVIADWENRHDFT